MSAYRVLTLALLIGLFAPGCQKDPPAETPKVDAGSEQTRDLGPSPAQTGDASDVAAASDVAIGADTPATSDVATGTDAAVDGGLGWMHKNPFPPGRGGIFLALGYRHPAEAFGLGLSGVGPGSNGDPAAAIGLIGTADFGTAGSGVSGKRPPLPNPVPHLKPTKPEIDGEYINEIVRRVARQHRKELMACYKAGLESDPELAGRMALTWKIDPEGNATGVHLDSSSTFEDKTVIECVIKRIQKWRFPSPKEGAVTVTYPFLFSPGEK